MTYDQEQEYLKAASHDEICGYLASKIRRERTLRKESQEAFAKRAGVALRTFKRLEIDGRGHLDTFVKVLKALDKGPYLQLLFPIPASTLGNGSWEGRIAALQEKQKLAASKGPRSDRD